MIAFCLVALLQAIQAVVGPPQADQPAGVAGPPETTRLSAAKDVMSPILHPTRGTGLSIGLDPEISTGEKTISPRTLATMIAAHVRRMGFRAGSTCKSRLRHILRRSASSSPRTTLRFRLPSRETA